MNANELSPPLVYGTAWKEDDTAALTRLAIEAGFRGVDTANQRKHYHEQGVGDALAAVIGEGFVARDDLFLQTKFTYQQGQDDRLPYDPEATLARQVEQSFASSLEHLGTDYIDSLLLHGPSARVGLTDADREVWRAMEELVETDQLRVIGVSNVTAEQLALLVDWADVAPAFVQNRCFARAGWDRAVRDVCARNGITYQGFSLLTANVSELRSDVVSAVARRHEVTVPQVVFRFADQIEILPLTGTTDAAHMKEDLACFDFRLTDDEVEAVEGIGTPV